MLSTGIWIVGSSFVRRLRDDLQRHNEVLGVPLPVQWIGQGGLTFQGLRPLIDREARGPHPAYIVLHLGANDVTELSSYAWRNEMEISVLYLKVKYPDTRIIWSDMLPRQQWRNVSNCRVVEEARVRCQLRAVILREGGAVIKHETLSKGAYLAPDGVHLSEEGQRIFWQDIEEGILKVMGYTEEPQEKELPGPTVLRNVFP